MSFPGTGRRRRNSAAEAQRYTEIGRRRSIAPKTVASHVAAIFSKLQVADRKQAIILARDAGRAGTLYRQLDAGQGI
jgi:hypothetical protein